MLSPKMQRAIRVNESQILMLSERAQYDHSLISTPENNCVPTLNKQYIESTFHRDKHGYLYKRTADCNKWQLRWFILYQNLLFYYDNDTSTRPSGIIFLEGCFCERIVSAPSCINAVKNAQAAAEAAAAGAASAAAAGASLTTSIGTGLTLTAGTTTIPSLTAGTSTSGKESVAQPAKPAKEEKLQHCFSISFRKDNLRQYELRASSESECSSWILAIRDASFNKLLLQKEELEQKHVHLLQVVESEKTAKWQYTQHCEELALEIKKLRIEICALRKECRPSISSTPGRRESFAVPFDAPIDPANLTGLCSQVQDSVELRKIKKVQSFFRGWLCRRRWKQIVEEYIKSPHAESMRKRNHLVFSMVEAEEEYMEQLEVLVSCFLRPFRMAASSKRPPCTHEDVNSIFLNSETVLFLHQIFLKGLTSRLESWPTLVLGDLFDMLLPMLSIYQEYVRNHHYSLQVLTECKNNLNFATVLKRLEAKQTCQGRSLETFLTYPMHQIPRYIITLHELLAHTPHDHVERKSLQNARQQLEDLSRQMHDEVSETENLRKNLAVERMIVEGCDILLDVNQVFVRQGSLVQVPPGKGRIRSRLASFKSERDYIRQCFLFSNHLIIATRTSGGRLHLLSDLGKINLADASLVEDPSDSEKEDDTFSVSTEASSRTHKTSSSLSAADAASAPRDFKITVDTKTGARHTIHLVAATAQEREAWISDISQCLDNIHMSMLSPGLIGTGGASLAHHHALRTDPKLFKDDVDIRFSRTLNSCKLPQVRYATPERLLERLTDLRFLSIDFLNTFLLTYRVFTDGETVLNALKKVFYDPPMDEMHIDGEHHPDLLDIPGSFDGGFSPRRTSGASSVSGYCSEGADRDRSFSTDSSFMKYKSLRKIGHQQSTTEDNLEWIPEQTGPIVVQSDTYSCTTTVDSVTTTADNSSRSDESYLSVPTTIATSSSSDTLTETTLSGPSSPSNLSSVTLVGSTGSGSQDKPDTPTSEEAKHFKYSRAPTSPLPERLHPKRIATEKEPQPSPSSATTIAPTKTTTIPLTSSKPAPRMLSPPLPTVTTTPCESQSKPAPHPKRDVMSPPATFTKFPTASISPPKISLLMDRRPSAGANVIPHAALIQHRHSLQMNGEGGVCKNITDKGSPRLAQRNVKVPEKQKKNSFCSPQREPPRRFSESDDEMASSIYTTPRGSLGGASLGTISSRASMQHDPIMHCSSKVGVVITSYRQSHRSLESDPLWSSTSTAAAAFAIATSASSNPRDEPPEVEARNRKDSVVSSPATMRVLNVLRHWISKHFQDFEQDTVLRSQAIAFLDDITCSPNLLPSEHRSASQLLRILCREDLNTGILKLDVLLTPPSVPSKESIETLSALEIAEQMTYLDHQIFLAIRSDEFLGQAWMKADKKEKAEHIILMTKRFNDGSRLVSSEIISRQNMASRVAAIEKWTAVADICRCLHNFNGVLQICAAFTNAAVYRLKKTWDKVPKTIKQTITKLQAVVCSDGRFRSMREALHRSDPPCIPYLGMYLTDLSFIEEGTPDFTPDGLLNFSKMRMIAHVIREIRHFQQTPYKIDHIPKVSAYLLDTSLPLDDDELYRRSLQIEPRSSRLSAPNTAAV